MPRRGDEVPPFACVRDFEALAGGGRVRLGSSRARTEPMDGEVLGL